MRKQVRLLIFFLIAFLESTSAQQADSIHILPPVNLARVPKLDIKHIALDLRFNWQKKQAYGIASITFSPLLVTNKITLDAGMLTINSIVLENGTILKFNYDGGDKNDGLEILLDREYSSDENVVIKIDYHTNWINRSDLNNLWGSYGKGIRFFEPTSTEPRKRRQIWSMGLPESNRYWFPCYDSPNDFRTTQFIATVDKNLTVISNGTLMNTRDNKDGTHTFHFKMDKPYANHQTSFVVGEYTDVKKLYDGIILHNFSYPDEVEGTIASVERLPDMIKFFSEMTGTKYPYPAYSQVFVQEFPWGGGHNITASTISENMVDDFGTHTDFLYLWDGVEANDLAAQWFGNLLTPYSWEHSWLNKSFATYFSGLYSEYKNGFDEFQLWNRSFNHSTYLNDWNTGIRRPIVTKNYDSPGTMTGDNYAVLHGAEVLHMLRKQLGEEKWWKSIRYYVKSNTHKTVTTEDFKKAIEESTGEKVDWFFDQWIYKMGHPVFEVTKNYDNNKKQLTLHVTQTQKIDFKNKYPEVDYFKGKMEIEIDGRIEQVWIEPKEENVFIFKSFQLPEFVNFDYGSAWIKEIKFEKVLDELLYQFVNDKDVLGRSSVMAGLAAIANNDTTSANNKEKIYAAFRKVIAGKSYWRFRQNAMAQLRGLLVPPFDNATITMLLSLIKKEGSWIRASAINFLGMTKDKKYASLYISYFNDKSDRVINAAAIALGKSKSPKAFDALSKLKDKPSWKNQSLISSLVGLKELGDARGVEIALTALKDSPAAPRWTLTAWDFRVYAAQALVALKKNDAGYPVLLERFKKSMQEDDINDIFSNVLLITTLADSRGQEVFELLKMKFKDDTEVMQVVDQYEAQFKEAIKIISKQIK